AAPPTAPAAKVSSDQKPQLPQQQGKQAAASTGGDKTVASLQGPSTLPSEAGLDGPDKKVGT
ncbi:MAG: cytochrome bc complex cytochrome b subunit, partial [Nitrososphaera sp.]